MDQNQSKNVSENIILLVPVAISDLVGSPKKCLVNALAMHLQVGMGVGLICSMAIIIL